MNITLPGHQIDLAKEMIALGKPTVLLMFTGGLYDLGDLIHEDIAIVQGCMLLVHPLCNHAAKRPSN
jgi:hypothetical protein